MGVKCDIRSCNTFEKTQRKLWTPPEDLSLAAGECLLTVSTTGFRESNFLFSLFFFFLPAEYYTLCPGGEGFRPNPITIILEGEFIAICRVGFNKDIGLGWREAGRKAGVKQCFLSGATGGQSVTHKFSYN